MASIIIGSIFAITGFVFAAVTWNNPYPASATEALLAVQAHVHSYRQEPVRRKRHGPSSRWKVILVCSYAPLDRGEQWAEVQAGDFPTKEDATRYGDHLVNTITPLWADPAKPGYAVIEKSDADRDRLSRWIGLGASGLAIVVGSAVAATSLARLGKRPASL